MANENGNGNWFLRQVSLGNLIQIIAILVAGVLAYSRFDYRQTEHQKVLDRHSAAIDRVQEQMSLLTRNQDKLTWLMEQTTKKPQ